MHQDKSFRLKQPEPHVHLGLLKLLSLKMLKNMLMRVPELSHVSLFLEGKTLLPHLCAVAVDLGWRWMEKQAG